MVKNRLVKRVACRRLTAAESGVSLALRRLRDVVTAEDVARYLGGWVMTWARAVGENVIDEDYPSLARFFSDYENVVADDAVDSCDDAEFKGYLAELGADEVAELKEEAIALVREYAPEAMEEVVDRLGADPDKRWVLSLIGELQ